MWMRKVEAPEIDEFGPADEPALVCSETAFAQAFHYWRGASGRLGGSLAAGARALKPVIFTPG